MIMFGPVYTAEYIGPVHGCAQRGAEPVVGSRAARPGAGARPGEGVALAVRMVVDSTSDRSPDGVSLVGVDVASGDEL
jgi:hypothetical protein